ncbi:MAG: hypothetical protein IJD49_07390 [Clostridia bacterium]|nr:hypothetical protein [Clostridia bacterium]
MKGNERLLKILAAAAAVIIVIYFAAEMYSLTSRTYTSETIYEQTVLETIDAKMYVIRDETLLSTTSSGVTVPLAENGERVSKGSTIAAVFPSEASAENYVNAKSLSKKLESYQKISSQLKYDNVDVNKLNDEIGKDFISMLDSAYCNDYSNLADYKLSFAEKLSRKQISLNRDVDCSAQISELQNEISALNSGSSPSEIITAEAAGYYVSKVDGYENVLTVADVDSLTKERLDEAFEAEKSKAPAGSIGKIIDGYNWYVAAVIESARVSEISDGKTVDLIFSENGEDTVTTYIHSVKAVDSENSLVVFRCNLMNESLTGLRMVDGKIVINDYTGLKVSRDAVRLDEEGNSGVFVRRGNIVNFRSLNILYSEEDFVIASKPSENSDIKLPYTHAKLYDEVIISGKELKDGMVIGR